MDANELFRRIQSEEEKPVPSFYTDSVDFQTNLYGFCLQFNLMGAGQEDSEPQCKIRMSPQHAKIMTLLLRKNVQEYEKRIGHIVLPGQLYQELGVEDE